MFNVQFYIVLIKFAITLSTKHSFVRGSESTTILYSIKSAVRLLVYRNIHSLKFTQVKLENFIHK